MNVKDLESRATSAAGLLKAMANEKRLIIMCALHQGEKCVGDLEKIVGLSQSALSQHLARLRKDKMVKTRRDAQTIYYSLDNVAVQSVMSCLCGIYGKDD
jgi:DNA-binding transcriptional ArsR family regulator